MTDFFRGVAESQSELGFNEDLSDRIASLPVRGKHDHVAELLSHAFPNTTFRLALEARDPYTFRDGRILDSNGRQVAESFVAWIEQEIRAAGSNWRARFAQLENSPLVRTSIRIVPLVFVARLGEKPADFLQAVVDCEAEFPAQRFLETCFWMEKPEDAWRRQDGAKPDETQAPIGTRRYRLSQLEHVGSFVQRNATIRREAYPSLRAEAQSRAIAIIDGETGQSVHSNFADAFGYPETAGASHLERWYRDWAASSAGHSGNRPEHHWVLQMHEGVFQGKAFSEGIPRWVIRRRLPRFDPKRVRHPSDCIEWLRAFDQKAGHSFAWYFYMLHGNRIERTVGERMAEAVEQRTTWLAPADRAVLHAWGLKPYGF